jgi:hypothetical protein
MPVGGGADELRRGLAADGRDITQFHNAATGGMQHRRGDFVDTLKPRVGNRQVKLESIFDLPRGAQHVGRRKRGCNVAQGQAMRAQLRRIDLDTVLLDRSS